MFPSSSANSHNNSCFVDPLPFFSDVTTNFSSFSIPSSPFYLYHDPDPFLQPLSDDVVTRDQPIQEEKPKKKKKDRHSKINTAQGPRDRRMRLSLEVARKFFDLQDMLEFDKASKTVEWLLNQSKSAIKDLYRLNNNGEGIISSSPSSSECDVVSGVIDELMDSSAPIDDSDKVPAKKEKKTAMRTQNSRGIVARESRKQARARAKERTMEKMWIRKLSSHLISNPSEEKSGTEGNNMKPFNTEEVAHQVDEIKELGLIEEQMIVGNSYSSFTAGTYGLISQLEQYPLRDFQMLPKQWEAYNNSTHLC